MSHLWHGGPQGQTPFKVGDIIEVTGNKEDGEHTITAVSQIPGMGTYTYSTTYYKKSPKTGEIVKMISQIPHTLATKVSRRNRKSTRKNSRRRNSRNSRHKN
jgi:hypothetical protein